MVDRDTGLMRFYPGWQAYNGLLVDAVAPLTDEQLTLRAGPALRAAWEIAAHIIVTRVAWFHDTIGVGDVALSPPREVEEAGLPPLTAAQLAQDLVRTWELVEGALAEWSPQMLDDTFMRRGHERTRGWIVWHVIEHDAHHGGELGLTLGMHGLPAPEL